MALRCHNMWYAICSHFQAIAQTARRKGSMLHDAVHVRRRSCPRRTHEYRVDPLRGNMAYDLVDDDLWDAIRPILPPAAENVKRPGPKQLNDRRVLGGILFVLRSGIPWEDLPKEMGCGSGMTCWRRMRAWQSAGVWVRLYPVLLARLPGADRIDFSRAGAHDSSVRPLCCGKRAGNAQPTTRKRKRAGDLSSSPGMREAGHYDQGEPS
jgi:transposase